MYINLKLHTDYTLLEGVGRIEQYVNKAKELNCTAIGLTDKNLYSCMKMYNLCKSKGINLVLGLEVYIYGVNLEGKFALNLYAIGYNGYKSLVNLASLSYSKKGVLEISDIKKASDIIIIAGGINSEIYGLIENLDLYNAKNTIIEYKKLFKNFYLELPSFSMIKQCRDKYIEFSRELDVELVVTNDTYYLEKEDSYLQKIVSAIRENTKINSVKNYYTPNDLYFKTEDEIRNDLKDVDIEILEKAINNTEYIASICNFKFDKIKNNLPTISLDISEGEYLKKLVYEKLKEIYKNNYEIAKKRCDYELEIIDKMGFSSYFLIVYDIVRYAKENNILVGPGRGSAAGCIVSYLLGITRVDPIKYNLMFERFLNSGRTSMPDIDLDFETDKKDEVIQYVMDKYGIDHVSNIITFSTMKEKNLKKDLARVFKCNENSKKLFPYIQKLMGNVRHNSIHASGVIISKRSLNELVPVNRIEALNINVCQYQMEELEKMGLLKVDFLSLSNLDILSSIINLTKIKLEDIPLNDEKTFEIYNKGETLGIFQVEAEGITRLIKRYRINNFLDISLVLALYRPGPLKSGMVNRLIDIKNKGEKVIYLIPELKDILEQTKGVIIYQEQIMMIAKKIAGFSLNEADELRRAISKKKMHILENMKKKFIENSINNGYSKEKVEKLYEQIEKFGEYGFNKAHTIPYAMISYYTAYFKAHYLKEFVTSIINSQIGVHDKLINFIEILRKKHIDLLKPDINKSKEKFSIEDNNIRYGIYSITNISKSLSKDIVIEREKNGIYKDIVDFVYRLKNYGLTIRQFETLSKVGVFDIFDITRKELVKNSKEIFSLAENKKNNKDNPFNKIFFDTTDENKETYIVKNIKEYELEEKLKLEKELLGIMISIPKNDILEVITNKYSYSNQYIFSVNNKWVNISDINKLKGSSVSILLDNLSEGEKNNLKKLIKYNGGSAIVKFFENKTLLKTEKPILFNISKENIKKLIDIVSKENIVITLK